MVRRMEKREGYLLHEIREGPKEGKGSFSPGHESLLCNRAIKQTEKAPGSRRWRQKELGIKQQRKGSQREEQSQRQLICCPGWEKAKDVPL